MIANEIACTGSQLPHTSKEQDYIFTHYIALATITLSETNTTDLYINKINVSGL